jgi:hypothetical protein
MLGKEYYRDKTSEDVVEMISSGRSCWWWKWSCNDHIRVGGLGRVVREVRQHPEDHEFESQRWQ